MRDKETDHYPIYANRKLRRGLTVAELRELLGLD
jgi:hypothetical protein